MTDTSNDTAAIERDLDRTRSRLGTHLDELQNRLTPGQVLDDLMAYFRGSEGGAVGGALLENIRSNPMPAAVTGIGLAWLMATTPRTGSASSSAHIHYGREDHDATLIRIREAEQGVTRLSDDTDETYSDRITAARGQAMGLARHTQETAEAFGQRVRDAFSSAQDAVARKAQGVRDSVGDALNAFGASAQDTMRGAASSASGMLSQGGQMGGQLGRAVTESPVVLGALGLAAGALLGLMLPRTEQEEAVLGGAAGQLRDAATGLAQQAVDSGRHVASAVADKVREGADAQGLSNRTPGQLVDAALSGDLASNAKEVLTGAMRAGDEAVRREVKPSA